MLHQVKGFISNTSLRTLLVTGFTALVIGAVGTVSLLSYHAGRNAVTTLAEQLLAEIGDRADQHMAEHRAGLRNIVHTNAVLIQQGRLDPEDVDGLERYFAAQLGLAPGVDSIGLVTERRELRMLARQGSDALILRRFDAATGYRLHHYRADSQGHPRELIESRENYDPHDDPPGKPWYPSVREDGQGSWRLSVSLAKGQKNPALVSFYALPFDDGQGTPQGVLVAGMTLTDIGEHLQGLRISPHGQAFVVDREGLLVATSTGEMPFGSGVFHDHAQNVAVEPRRLAAIASTDSVTRQAARQLLMLRPDLGQLTAPLSFDFDLDGQRYLAKVTLTDSGISHPDWLTLIVAPQRDFTALIAAQISRTLLFAALALFIAVLLGLVAAGAISRPLRELSAATRRLAEGEFDQPLPPSSIRELRELGESFDRMTRRLRDAFAELQQLNQNLRVAEDKLAAHTRHLEQRVAERTAALRQSEAHLRSYFEQPLIGIAVTSLDKGWLEINDRMCAILGYSREELANKTWADLTHPDDLSADVAEYERVMRGEIEGYSLEKRYIRADGRVVPTDLSVACVRGPDAECRYFIAMIQDVTERRRTEEALRESEEKFRLAFDNANTGMCLVDIQGRLLQVNDKMSAIFGYSRRELEGMTVNDLAVPEDAALSAEYIGRALHGGSDSATFEKRYRHRDGRIIHGQIASTLVRDVRSQPRYFISQVQDITARKQAEAALLREQAFSQALIDSIPGIFSLLDRTGRFLRWNDRARRQILGHLDDEKILRINALEMFHPDDRDRIARHIAALFDTGQNQTLQGRVLVRGGPEYQWFLLSAQRLMADADRYLVGIGIDIAELKQAEESLRASEARYRLLAENSSDFIAVVDSEGRYTYVSPSVEKLRGYSVDEVMQQTFAQGLRPQVAASVGAHLAERRAAAETGALLPEFRDDLEQFRQDGTTVWTDVTITPLVDAADRYSGCLVVSRDISERKRYELKLQEARAAAETASRAKSEFLAQMSHEIRTPMNVVLGLAQVLNREPLTADQRDMVERIRIAGQSLLAIINDILDLSKIEADRLRLEPSIFTLETLLERLDALMAPGARAKGLAFRVERAGPSPGPLLGDALRLEQVAINLLGNAIKFTEEGQVNLSVRTLRSDANAIRLRFSVEDTGIGIAPEALERLFAPFTQAEEGITRRFGGTGLGLTISKRLLSLMGGEIGVESQVGQGSNFWFELSLARASADAAALSFGARAAAESTRPAGPRLAGAHVLVVDDSAMNRDLAERVLALEGATATLVADGRQAVDRLKAGAAAFDAVLMDVRMPVMDGLTATRLIREELGLTDLPIIALTAGVLPAEQEAARAAGVSAVLPKPLDLEQMTVLLLNWIKPGTRVLEAAAVSPDRAVSSDRSTTPTESVADDTAEGFPDIAGIDRVRAAEILMNNREMFLWLLQRFAEKYVDAAEHTIRDLTRGDRETAARRMHTLRGGAGQLGARQLMALAGELEMAIDQGETGLDDRLAALDRQVAELLAASAPWRVTAVTFGARAPATPVTLDADPIGALRADLRRRNLRARHRFEELRPVLARELGESGIEALERAIRDLRYEEALGILDAVKAA